VCFLFLGDLQALEQAVLVFKQNAVDLSEVERWSPSGRQIESIQSIEERVV